MTYEEFRVKAMVYFQGGGACRAQYRLHRGKRIQLTRQMRRGRERELDALLGEWERRERTLILPLNGGWVRHDLRNLRLAAKEAT